MSLLKYFKKQTGGKNNDSSSSSVNTNSGSGGSKKINKNEPQLAISTSLSSSTSNSDAVLLPADLTSTLELNENKKKGRSFQAKWKDTYPWLLTDSNDNVDVQLVYCSICIDAVKHSLPLPQDSRSTHSKHAFVTNGFRAWNPAISAFQKHEKSDFHKEAVLGLSNMKKVSVVVGLSNQKKNEMKDARFALEKIFETVNFFAQEGLPLRGKEDDNSKFIRFLRLRAIDIPVLNSWLNRNQHKWISHSVVEEMLKSLADAVLNEICCNIGAAPYFSIMMDETSDISKLEQVSFSVRFVNDSLDIAEEFLGFYETKNTTAEMLYQIVNDIMIRLQLNPLSLRGQCFDGASNVSGNITGVQARIRKENPKALFVHCNAHRLNLVVQDALSKITFVRDFIGCVKEMINFVRDSPKRLGKFKDLQADNESSTSPNLTPFCPTQWTVRVKSLKTIRSNYATLIDFFNDIANDQTSLPAHTSTACGFLNKLESFSFHFYLNILIGIFEGTETVNTELQSKNLQINESNDLISALRASLIASRNEECFNSKWSTIVQQSENLELEEPKIPKIRKMPRRYETQSSPHEFEIPEFFRKQYYEVIDQAVSSIDERFESDTMQLLNDIEKFVINCGPIDNIISFYSEDDFDYERLILHRDMLSDIMKNQNKTPKNIKDVVDFLKNAPEHRGLLPELVKLIKVILTIPVSTCTCERSFSALRRLKTYLRSTLCSLRINNLAILHIHKDIANKLDSTSNTMKTLINNFINCNPKRRSTFAQ